MAKRDQGLGIGGWGRKAGFWVLRAGGWGVAIVLAILVASLSGFARPRAQSDLIQNLTIALRVYDYAGVEAGELARAQEEASRVLARIGIEAIWLNCRTSGGPKATGACEQPLQPAHIVLRILAGRQLGAASPGNDIGSALVPSPGGRGAYASIYFDRVEYLARRGDASRATILGHAMAHELGHLLLRSTDHAPLGIMRARWSPADLENAARRSLLFGREQGAEMRADVRARWEASNTAEATLKELRVISRKD